MYARSPTPCLQASPGTLWTCVTAEWWVPQSRRNPHLFTSELLGCKEESRSLRKKYNLKKVNNAVATFILCSWGSCALCWMRTTRRRTTIPSDLNFLQSICNGKFTEFHLLVFCSGHRREGVRSKVPKVWVNRGSKTLWYYLTVGEEARVWQDAFFSVRFSNTAYKFWPSILLIPPQ